jgi:hypothetical protein
LNNYNEKREVAKTPQLAIGDWQMAQHDTGAVQVTGCGLPHQRLSALICGRLGLIFSPNYSRRTAYRCCAQVGQIANSQLPIAIFLSRHGATICIQWDAGG